jgi:nucleolar protein 56
VNGDDRMSVNIGICPIGVFGLKDGKIAEFVLFERDASEIAKKMELFENGESFEELDELILKIGDEEIDRSLQNPAMGYLKKNLRMIATGKGIPAVELNKLLSQIGISKSRQSIKQKERKDRVIVQVVSAVSDLDKILNTMTERLREWFGLHYPELRIRDHFKLVKRIAKYGHRKNWEGFKDSVGAEFSDDDVEIVKSYAESLANFYKQREKMEKYLDKTTHEEIPNLRAILGGTLAARLLSKAGTLERLAKMPSSKLQILGAEKSVFRFMKEKKQGLRTAKIPKFGILFTHPDISGSSKNVQGKIARLLASKCTMAARVDFYSKEDKSADMIKDYEKKKKEALGSKHKSAKPSTANTNDKSNTGSDNKSRSDSRPARPRSPSRSNSGSRGSGRGNFRGNSNSRGRGRRK